MKNITIRPHYWKIVSRNFVMKIYWTQNHEDKNRETGGTTRPRFGGGSELSPGPSCP